MSDLFEMLANFDVSLMIYLGYRNDDLSVWKQLLYVTRHLICRKCNG